MHSKKSLLLWAAVFALALPLFFCGTASAIYLPDGAVQSATTGTWDLPVDMGVCVTGIQADGTLNVDTTITSNPDCIAKTWPAYTTKAACGDTGNSESAAHFWANTCVANDGTPISLKGLDRNATMCSQAAIAAGKASGTWALACTSSWQYLGQGIALASGTTSTIVTGPGFCYATANVTSAYGTKAACVGYNSLSTPNLNGWASSTSTCSYNFGVSGGILSKAIIPMNTLTAPSNLAAGQPIPDVTGKNMGQCLLGGFTWNNYYVASGTTTMAGGTVATIKSGGNANCLRCHSTVSQTNAVAERWKESYLLQGHKNMLRKVTAGQRWAGPDANGNIALYTGSAYSDGSINWTNATAGSSNLPLLYIFGDWMAPAPAGLDVIVNNGGHALYNGSSAYSCSACHSTGFSNQTPAYCNGNRSMLDKASCDAWKYPTGMTSNQRSTWTEAGTCTLSSYVNSTDCAAAGASWVPATGVEASLYPNGGIEPENTYPGLDWGTATAAWKPRWDQNGIQCSRCHAVTMPEVYDASFNAVSGNGHDYSPPISSGAAITNMCFSCHQATAKTNNGTGLDVDLNNPATPGLNGTNNGFTGHPIGEWYLNSPHARFTGSMQPNALGKYEIGMISNNSFTIINGGTFNTAFNDGFCSASTYVDSNGQPAEVKTHADCTTAGGTWSYRSDQGSCTSCHDVHNSLFVASESEKAIKKECVDCHTTTTAFGTDANKTTPPTIDLGVLAHPRTANTPFDVKFGSPCETCHMPSDPGTKFAMHLWRINTDPNYSTFPTSSQVSAGQKLANTAPDDKGYANAIWVDLDLACGQCHESTGANYVSGNPLLTKTQLAVAASGMHTGDSNLTNDQCLTCHNVAQGGYDAVQQGVNHHNGSCTECHGTAAWPLHQKVTTFYGNPVYSGGLDTPGTGCLACHDGRPGAATNPSATPNYNNIIPDGASDNHHSDHGSCTTCHGPHGGLGANNAGKSLAADGGAFCLTCHGNTGGYAKHHAVQAVVDAGMNCWNCHGTVNAPSTSYANAGVPAKAAPEDNTACLQCHSSNTFTATTGKTIRPVIQGTNHHNGSCTTCHKAEPFKFLATGDLSTVGTITAQAPISDSDASVMTLCLSCHSSAKTRSADSSTLAAITPKIPDYGPVDNHHRGHGGNTADPVGYRCLGCHGSTTLDGTLAITASGLIPATVSANKGFTGGAGADATSNLCIQCHSIVQSGSTQNHHAGACLNCHHADQDGGPGITAKTVNGTTVSWKPTDIPTWQDCSACHGTPSNNGAPSISLSSMAYMSHNQPGDPGTCDTCHAYQVVTSNPTTTTVYSIVGVKPTDSDHICGQCHGGSAGAGATTSGAPYLDATTLASDAAIMHSASLPTAKFVWTASTTADYTVLFDASSSTCPAGGCTYSWSFGDGQTGTGVNPSHLYSAGTYTATLNYGSASYSLAVTARYIGANPTAMTASASSSGMTTNVTYNVTGGVSPYTVKITWGDGTSTNDSNATDAVSHTYAAAGNYSGSVYAVDSGVNGSMKTSATVTFNATATMSSVTGTVYQSNGTTTVSGVYLYLMQGATTKKISVSSATGTYTFTNVPAGSYTIKAVKSGYTFGIPAASITVSGNMTQNINSVTP